MIVTASDWIPHPEGIFLGRITAVEDTNQQLEGVPEKTFTIETKPMNSDGPTGSIRHQIYCIRSETSQFSRMFRAVCGQEVNTATEVCTKALIGGQAAVAVQHYTKDSGRKGHRIKQWWPHKNVNFE